MTELTILNCARFESTIKCTNLENIYLCRGVPRIWQGGGGKNFFSSDLEICIRDMHTAHGEAMSFARGVRGHAPPRKFFKMVQFGVFWCIY